MHTGKGGEGGSEDSDSETAPAQEIKKKMLIKMQ
jgi:hypothetical protein